MRAIAAAALATGLVASVTALQLVERSNPNVLGLDINKKAVRNPFERDALRRRQTVTATLDNEQTLYFANVSVGTPAQDLRLHIDTGSSDLWTNAKNSRICSLHGDPCSDSGTYNANSSSTYKFVNSNFNVSYEDGSGASGDYVTDTVSIGGKSIKSMQFGVGYDSTSPEGILGIGYIADEAAVDRANGKGYSNLPQAMVDGGLIKSNAYSLWLDDLQSSSGSLLFGGVDTSKYHGDLQTLPIQKEFDQYAEFIITLSGMSLNAQGKNNSLTTDLPTAVILDSGSTLTYLPDDLITQIFSALQVQYSQREGAALADCSLANSDITLDFTFTSATISVPMNELVLSSESDDSNDRQDPDSEDGGSQSSSGHNDGSVCIFGIAPADGSTAVLGDTFLRSAYVVYDLANNEISLAQTNFNATDSNVKEIGTGSGSVPGATLVASAVQAQVSETGGARIAVVSGTGTSGSGPLSTTLVQSEGLSSRQVSFGGLALVSCSILSLVSA